jgi:hypothetical protein
MRFVMYHFVLGIVWFAPGTVSRADELESFPRRNAITEAVKKTQRSIV